MKTHTIKIAKDYSPEPAGRYSSDGDFSGERFRKEMLVPNLVKFDKLIVDFDGMEGSGSSFLEEAFGGLIHYEKFSKEELQAKLEFISKEDESIVSEVWTYIDRAAKNGSR